MRFISSRHQPVANSVPDTQPAFAHASRELWLGRLLRALAHVELRTRGGCLAEARPRAKADLLSDFCHPEQSILARNASKSPAISRTLGSRTGLLVSRVRDSLTKSGHLGEDLVGGFRPDERPRRVVGDREVLANGGLQRADTAVRAALDLLLAEEREPALDEIEPRGAGRREVHVKPRVPGEPPPHARGFVRAVVVEDQVRRRGPPARGRRSSRGTGETPDSDADDDTPRSPCPSPHRAPQTATSCRDVGSRACGARASRRSSAESARCGPAPGSDSSRRRSAPRRDPAAPDRGRRRRAPCRRRGDHATA